MRITQRPIPEEQEQHCLHTVLCMAVHSTYIICLLQQLRAVDYMTCTTWQAAEFSLHVQNSCIEQVPDNPAGMANHIRKVKSKQSSCNLQGVDSPHTYRMSSCQPLTIPVQVGEPVALAGGHWSLMRLLLRPGHRQTGESISKTGQTRAGQKAPPFLQVTGAQVKKRQDLCRYASF